MNLSNSVQLVLFILERYEYICYFYAASDSKNTNIIHFILNNAILRDKN